MIRADAFARQAELHRRIAVTVHGALPPAADHVVWTYREVGARRHHHATAFFAGGVEVPVVVDPRVLDAARELRAITYSPEEGAWFAVTFTITAAGRMSVDYDRQSRPLWDAAPSASDFAKDLQRFPRASTSIPGWLADEIAAGHMETGEAKKHPWWTRWLPHRRT